MPYGETKVYFDGSHYIAIPHTETPRKQGRYKGPPKENAPVKQDSPPDRKDIEKQFVECEPEVRVFDVEATEQHELSDRKRAAQSTKQYELLDRDGNVIPPKEHEPVDRVPDKKPTEKEVFNQLYAEFTYLSRKEKRKRILESMKPYFEDEMREKCILLSQGAVGGGAGGALGVVDAFAVGGVGAGVEEALPDELDGCGGGVDEVVGVEPIVSQFVHQDLICREIECAGRFAGQAGE